MGFLFGIACVVGLVAVARHGRHRRCGGHERHGRRGWGERAFLHRLFEKLDTTPGQEKVIREELGKVRDRARGLRRHAGRWVDDAAAAFRGESFDETAMGEMFAAQDDELRELRKEIVGAMATIHEALDPAQREQLAGWISRRRGMGFGGPYRGWA